MMQTENVVVSPLDRDASVISGAWSEPATTIDGWVRRADDDAINLGGCEPFQRIKVKTRRSVYELIVLAGRAGEVLVRGGRFFPEFREAILTGSTAGGSALKPRSLGVGLCMEFIVGDRVVVTSPVSELSQGE
jgi:hypothetical protein